MAAMLAVVMVLGIVLGMFPGSVNAATSSEIQNQIDNLEQQQEELKQQMQELESQLVQNKKDIKSMVARKNGIDQQIAVLHAEVTVVKQTITAYSLMIADKQDELEQAEKKLDLLYKAYKNRIRAMEEQGEISYWSVIFAANSFFEMLDQLNMVAEIAKADRQRMDEIRKVAKQVEETKEVLTESRKMLEETRKELEKTQETLDLKRSEADGLLLDLLAKGDAYELEMDESEKLQHELMDQIAGLEEDKEIAEWLEWLSTSVPPTTTTTALPTTTAPPTTVPPTTVPPTTVPPTTVPPVTTMPPVVVPSTSVPSTTVPPTIVPPTIAPTTPPTIPTTRPTTIPTETTNQAGEGNEVNGIVWYTPTKNYRISSKFGYRYHPITGKYTLHKGIDMAAPQGTPIFATRAGYVSTTAYQEGGAGYYVSINHGDGYRSIYMHMTHYIVKKGDYVEAGQIIGYVGSTGGSTGPHLHFGISYDGTYVDPQLYIDT